MPLEPDWYLLKTDFAALFAFDVRMFPDIHLRLVPFQVQAIPDCARLLATVN
jgi:hypothetical protein